MKKGNIILLNGVSSAGKTSLAEKLQELFEEPYYHLQVDVFYQMMPGRYFEMTWPERRPETLRMHQAFHQTVANMSDMGYHVIIDHVFEVREWFVDALERLQDSPVLFVGVHCPLAELQRRERERGDRTIGQAEDQLRPVHANKVYDLEVDTHQQTLTECAEQIKAYIESGQVPAAFKGLKETFTLEPTP